MNRADNDLKWESGLGTTTWLLPLLKVVGFCNLLLDHVELPHVLVLTVHLVNLLGWIGKGDPSWYLATLLLKVRVK